MGDDTALPGDVEEIESFVVDWMSDNRIPGASLAIVHGDDLVVADGFGARDLASNARATPETRYGVASITKSFAALAVLQQVASGRVALSDPVTQYVEFYEDLEEPPTIHELLSHSSRMPSDGASVALISRLIGEDPMEVPLSSERDFGRYVAGSTAERASEDRFFYYNTGYTVLGKLVAAVDGREFPRYVGEEILDPLGMDRSVVAPSEFDTLDDTMTPYREENGERVEVPFPDKGVGAAGGLVSTVEDLARYLQFQFSPDDAILDRSLLEEARSGHISRQTYIDGTDQQYGYGWMRRPFLGDDLIEHGGSLAVSTAYLGYLEDEHLGVALACNDSPETHPDRVGPALLSILKGEDPVDATRYYSLRRKARRLAGEYTSYRGIQTATVEPDDGTLAITFETALETEEVAAMPESAAFDDHSYYTIGAGGTRVPVEFVETANGMDLFYRRWRLHRELPP
ncbi:MAG: serine hydrolase [Halodesulfurarchaeum sp.]